MPLDWTPFVELINRHQRFILTTHVRPDGDGLGSMLALADVLERRGKSVRMVVASIIPPRYDFLDPRKRVERFTGVDDDHTKAEAVIVLDTGTWNQLGDFGAFLRDFPGSRMVIDHHLTQDDLGAIQLVDVTAEATGRLAYEAINALGGPLSAEAAHCIFVALAMDTGWFRHSNTTAASFALASKLVEAGAQPTLAYDLLFEQNSLARIKLLGLALDRIQVVAGGQVAYTEIYRDDYSTTGATPQDTEDLINYPRSIIGVEVAFMLLEQPRGGVKVSFRARSRVDVARLAQQFGGGGHRLAAGAILETSLPEARDRVLRAVENVLFDN